MAVVAKFDEQELTVVAGDLATSPQLADTPALLLISKAPGYYSNWSLHWRFSLW